MSTETPTVLVPELLTAASGASEVRASEPVQLIASRCEPCDRSDFPERKTCASCGAATTTEHLPGTGVLVGSTAVLHQPPGGKVKVPYYVGVAQLGDISIMGLLVGEGVDRLAPLGAPVECVAVPIDDVGLTYAFRLT